MKTVPGIGRNNPRSIPDPSLCLKLVSSRNVENFVKKHFSVHPMISTLDPYTKMHMNRTSTLSLMIADSISLDAREKREICLAASLHDIGKIGISPNILIKPSRLESFEFREVRRHPEIGAAILESYKGLSPVLPLVKHHHERFDGNGYPAGLAGDEIPLGARILAIADTFDAMTTDRPYQKRIEIDTAFEKLYRGANSQFDPRLVENFTKSFHPVDRLW